MICWRCTTSDDDPANSSDQYCDFFRHIELFREQPRSALGYLRRLVSRRARFAETAERSFCPALWRAIAERLASRDYDLVHCFGSVSVYEFHPLFAGLPNVITPYESHALYLRSAAAQGDWSARLRLPLVRRFERFMFAPFDRTVVISDADRALLLDLNPRLKIQVIPNGIELERFRPREVERDPATLLFVGNYDYPPNQDAARLLAERVLPRVRQALPAARLQLVGANPPAPLRDLANDHIEVTGTVPDVAPYLARATVFVCPLRIGAGLKNKVLEALAMGIPVVATPLSLDGIAARDGESALVAEVDDIAAMTVELLGDPARRGRLSRGGRALIEAHYSWAKTAASYAALYDEICAIR